jgi:hypothetical protein
MAKMNLEKMFHESFKGIFQQPQKEVKSIENLLLPKPGQGSPATQPREIGKELWDLLENTP